MKKIFIIVGIMVSCTLAHAKKTRTVTSEAFNVTFEIPASWEWEVDDDSLVATGDSVVMSIVGYDSDEDEEEGLEAKELFDVMVEQLDAEVEGEYEEFDNLNGFEAVLGYGVGEIEGSEAALVLLAAVDEEYHHIVYFMTPLEDIDEHKDAILSVIGSFSPLDAEDEDEDED